MDLRKSAVGEIVKNGTDVVSGYFLGKFSDVSKAVKVDSCTVNKCVPNIRLNSVNTAAELYEKHNIIDNNGKHNRAKTGTSVESRICRKIFARFIST